jgi:hypothetical protein
MKEFSLFLLVGALGLGILMGVVDYDSIAPASIRVDVSIVLAASMVSLALMGSPTSSYLGLIGLLVT